ncbi:hypothetical protein DXC51_06605 [Eisenbergiella massiliensis]|uniref:Uncharacterized protein n=1 Tax=Eisenbergiella massiliensis TaxID=1720294 RepID=A0A3E3I9A1_9FIRM|nr:hypothetical protein DXC51_06605 [Eisenbergiella massiliensis]
MHLKSIPPIYTPAQFFFPSYLPCFFPCPFPCPFCPVLFPCPFSPSQPTRPAEEHCPGGGGAGRFAQGAGCEGDSRMLTKFWSCFLKPPTDALPAIRQLSEEPATSSCRIRAAKATAGGF